MWAVRAKFRWVRVNCACVCAPVSDERAWAMCMWMWVSEFVRVCMRVDRASRADGGRDFAVAF